MPLEALPPILFLSSHHGTGACETLWLEASARLARKGHPVLGLVAWKNHDHRRAEILREAGGRVQFLHPALGNIASKLIHRLLPYGSIAYARYRSAVKSFRPKLVSISQGNDISALPWIEETKLLNLPYTLVTHGVVPSEWPDDPVRARLKKALLSARRTFWVARQNQTDVEHLIAARLPNAKIAWNPLRSQQDPALAWPESSSSTLHLACVSRLQVRPKGHELLLQALASEGWKNRDWKLTFFGDGENREGLQELTDFLGIQPKVFFAGHVSELADIWKQCHWLVQPSRHEGMPLSLIEALLAGRPALVTDVAGHAEVVTDGDNGIVAESPTVNALINALNRLWQLREQWPSMGERAGHRIRLQIPPDPVGAYAEELEKMLTER
jgi:glycosyltransferase involved in cell wall biosynthesis